MIINRLLLIGNILCSINKKHRLKTMTENIDPPSLSKYPKNYIILSWILVTLLNLINKTCRVKQFVLCLVTHMNL